MTKLNKYKKAKLYRYLVANLNIYFNDKILQIFIPKNCTDIFTQKLCRNFYTKIVQIFLLKNCVDIYTTILFL